MKISFDDLKNLFYDKLIKHNFSEKKAAILSEIFSDNTFSGVESHGIVRFPTFIKYVQKGFVIPDAEPDLIYSSGAVERWDGNFAAGPLNGLLMTERAIALAEKFGIGLSVIKNSNHWMRAGYYGWYAADKGFILICWTNTIPNLPPWGAKESTTGNNPFVIAVPRKDGNIVLDIAMSQFSYGTMYNARRRGDKLPFAGGYNNKNNLTDDPAEIMETQRPLPVGLWKGAGLSLLFDITAALLSGGRSTKNLSEEEGEKGPSQVFIAINPSVFPDVSENDDKINDILSYFKSADVINDKTEILYPGENSLREKIKNMKEGIELDDILIEKVKHL